MFSLLYYQKHKKIFYFIILLIFSITVNQYYGYKGINPIDSFFSFNSGYDVLNGYYPFKDYWTITGPFVDFIQALFFKIFGVSWFSYVLHASIINFLFVISTFYILNKLELDISYSFLYSFFLLFLAYPSSGTPYVDHQSSYFSIIAIYCFILAVKTNFKFYWFFLPVILGIAFLTKQAPSAHIFIIILLLSIIYFIYNFNIKSLLYIFLGSILFSLFVIIIFKIAEIPFYLFLEQYILFPFSLGENRLDFLFPLEFKRIFLRFKLIHLSLLILIIVIFQNTIKNFKYLINVDSLVAASLIGSSFALIAHQLMTINGIFIFFMIPILCGFSHIYYLKYLTSKNYVVLFLVILSFSSTLHYSYKYIYKRDFLDLSKVNISSAINANALDKKLNGVKWITTLYPNNPKQEINLLNEAIEVIKNDNSNKVLVTDYQFISVVLDIYDYSPNKYWYKHHVYPTINEKYFENYRKFFINQLLKNKIETIYTIKPLWGDDNVLEDILEDDCIKKTLITPILDKSSLLNCNSLKMEK